MKILKWQNKLEFCTLFISLGKLNFNKTVFNICSVLPLLWNIIEHIDLKIVAEMLTLIDASCVYHALQHLHWATDRPFVAQATLYFCMQTSQRAFHLTHNWDGQTKIWICLVSLTCWTITFWTSRAIVISFYPSIYVSIYRFCINSSIYQSI